MHLSHYGILTMVLLFLLNIPMFLFSKIDSTSEHVNQKIQNCMITATYDAVQSATITDKKAFDTKIKQDKVLETFYTSLSACYGSLDTNLTSTSVISNVPFVVLIDNDGLYISYGKDYTWGDEYSGAFLTTPIYTYSANYDNYTVQFMLDGTSIIYKNGIQYAEGSYENLKRNLDLDTITRYLPFLTTERMYEEEKQAVVTNVVKNKLNFYLNDLIDKNIINKQDDYNKRTLFGNNIHNVQYEVEIPLKSTDFARAINGPTVIAFYQGKQPIFVNNTHLNQYALAGSEIVKEDNYYICQEHRNGKDIYTYHEKECYKLLPEDKERFYTSMEKCASLGAYPCLDCIR